LRYRIGCGVDDCPYWIPCRLIQCLAHLVVKVCDGSVDPTDCLFESILVSLYI
jgi:hypothetical protein